MDFVQRSLNKFMNILKYSDIVTAFYGNSILKGMKTNSRLSSLIVKDMNCEVCALCLFNFVKNTIVLYPEINEP